jgi:hypothetical protein
MVRIGRSINDVLRKMKEEGTIDSYPDYAPAEPDRPGTTISTIVVGGFFRGYQELLELRLSHKNQALREPDLRHITDERTYGSGKLNELIESQDPHFAKYYVSMPPSHPSVSKVVEYSKKFIEAHADPIALELDPTICRAIGGRIHIVTITRESGFRWVPGFEPISEKLAQF